MDTLRIRLLPVEKGDCILIRFPDHSWAVVDCDRGAAPCVAAEIIGREEPTGGPVRFVLATHPHIDHVGGMRQLLGALTPAERTIGAFYHCGARFRLRRGATPGSYAYLDVAENLMRDQRIGVVSVLSAGQAIPLEPSISGMEIAVLSPDEELRKGGTLRSNTDRNNASVVLQITFRHTFVLLTGDIERAAWNRVVARSEFKVPQVLKVPHHGARDSMPPALVCSPGESQRWALISCGTDKTGTLSDKPHPDVLQSLWDSSWTTRCTGWTDSPRSGVQDQEYYPIRPVDDRYPDSLRLGLELCADPQTLEIQYGDRTACCVDNELVIAADGTITHSRPPGSKTCDG